MKLKKKIIIPVVLVAVVAAAIIIVPKMLGGGSSLPVYEANPLAKMDLRNTVSVTGTVKSEDATNVYSTLAYQVKSVNVKVGDVVSEGDVLCELDTDDLEATIQQQTAGLNSALAKAQQSLSVAQKNLETEKYNQENKYDAAVVQAENNVKAAEFSLESAETRLNSDTRARREYLDTFGRNTEYDGQYESLKSAVLQDQIAVDQAKQALENAKAALVTAKVQQKESLVSGQDQVTAAKLNTNFSDQWMQIEQLKKNLEDAIVKAPVSGTVTAVIAKEGGSGQGMLFVIEDTKSLKIDTKIKEYDVASVQTGQPAVIKSDGTGDDEYNGKVAKIAPTAVKAANGETLETTDVQFDTEIGVTQAGTRLKIGMKARIDIITEEKPGVFAVPYDAVVEDESGESFVYVARTVEDTGEAENGEQTGPKTIAEKVTVVTGMETDFYIEISSNQLVEGDLIISNPEGITAGMEILLAGSEADPAVAGMAGGPRGGMAVRMG